MTDEHELREQKSDKPTFWQSALRTIKGGSMETLVEEFTAEMTLVAEGLSEDQSRLNRSLQALEHRMDSMQERISEEQDRSLQRLQSQLDSVETAQAEESRDVAERLNSLERRLDAIDKRTQPRGKGGARGDGLIRQLTVLAAIVVGGWVLVTILNLFH